MQLTKIKLTREASNRVRYTAGRTGLTPNLLCRIGLCLSLADPTIPNPKQFHEEEREFNRYTLLGEHDDFFVALLIERCRRDGVGQEHLSAYFRAHLNRGVIILGQRVRSVADLVHLIPQDWRELTLDQPANDVIE